MSSERSPVTSPANYDNKSFWKNMDKDKKKEFLQIDTLYNRRFLETSRALVFGAVSGLAFSLLLKRVQSRYWLAGLASGFSAVVFTQMKSSPIHNQYFKIWDAVKNDKEALENIRDSTKDMSSDEFAYFYHRYLKFFYPELNAKYGEHECILCRHINK